MPLTRLELKNEYGLGNKKLFCAGDSKKDGPKSILGGVSVAGLVGILRQLGDLAEFAANVFHDLQEQVEATSSRWEKISNKIQHMESALPSLEKAIQGQRSCIHFAYIPGYSWHANVLPDKNKLLMSRLPNFMVDLYEECRSPPQLHLLDKFDSSGHGACLKRYSDPSYFKKALASSESIIFQKGRRKKKRRLRQGIGLQHPVQCSNSTQYLPTNIGKQSFSSDVSFSDTMSNSEIARKSIQLESEMKSKNILEKFSVIPCMESDEPNYSGPFKLERNHTNTFDFIVCTEPKHGIAFDTNLKPDWTGESLHSGSEQKSSNTVEQFPLNSCLEKAQSNNVSVIESDSNASDHITCSEPKQDFADDDSQQHIIPNDSFAASLETNLKPDWEGESMHSEFGQKSSNTLEQFPLNSCLENALSNNISVVESESNASHHIICSEPKQDFADDDSQHHIIPNASFAASLETNLTPEWEGGSLHSELEQKSSNTLEQFPSNSCLEKVQSNSISVIESDSNASDHIICSEPKQDFADDDSQQHIIPNASFAASLETNLKSDWEGESIHSEFEQKSSNTLEQFPLNSCLENALSNNISVIESESNASHDNICSEPKQDFADDDSQEHIIPNASFVASLETNLTPEWEGGSLHSELELKSSNTVDQFPLNSCLEKAQSNNVSVIKLDSNASDHIICSEPKQDFADDDSQQHIITNDSLAAYLETNLKPDWEGESMHSEFEQKSSNTLELNSCLENAQSNNNSVIESVSNASGHIICSEPKQDYADDDSQYHITPNASFAASSETNLTPDWEGGSLHSELELKSSNTLEQFPLNSCLENARSNNISVIESESNASDHIICSEPKQDFADGDLQQHIIPNVSFAASSETNLTPDWEGESLHSELELKSSKTLEQFPLISCLGSAQSNNISLTESESNASDHIICSAPKQDIAEQKSSLSASAVWYDQNTEVVKPACTSLYEHEVFNDILNLDSLQISHPSNSPNESSHFKNDDDEDTMFELAMEMPSVTRFENRTEANHGSNHSNITACDLETASLEKISSPNYDESCNLQDSSTLPTIIDQNQSLLSGSSVFNDNSNLIDQLSSKLSQESIIIDEQDEDEKTKLQNHSSNNFRSPAVHIWTNGNILGLEPSKPPDFTVKADSEAPTVTTSSFGHENIQRNKLVANSGPSHSLFMNADFTKLQKIVHHNDATELHESESKENIKVGSCSPPVECMKFSFLPMDDLKKTLLNLEFSGSTVHEGYDDIKYCHHSFQLISELSIGVEDSSKESDDDTFCRSSMYSDDDVFSYRSMASEELWEEDDQSQFQKDRVSLKHF